MMQWENGSDGKLDKLISPTENDFGNGKENTEYVMERWDNETWGVQNNNGYIPDVWGAIKTEVNKGWFLPSKSEWSAFADMLFTQLGVTTLNSNTNWVWTSSQGGVKSAFGVKLDEGVVRDSPVECIGEAYVSITF